jgi:RHS repeat-associated protein
MYVQQDADFNVTALVDTSGSVQERYIYDPYGAVSILAANWTTRSSSSYGWIYLHQGGRFDNATGLYGFRNRDFSPTLGRWLQNDPIGYSGGNTNLYGYEASSPVEALDWLGLECAKEYKLPKGLDDALKTAWDQSKSGTANWVEQGGSIFINKQGEFTIKALAERPQPTKAIEHWMPPITQFPKPTNGLSLYGTFHTHPLKPGEPEGDLSISGPEMVAGHAADLGILVNSAIMSANGRESEASFGGLVMIVRSGKCIFILKVDNAATVKQKAQQILREYAKCWADNKAKPVPERTEAALAAAVKVGGLCYYKVCKKPDGTFPGTAALVQPETR